MNKVEKMYSNAGIEPVLFYDCESYNQKVEKGYLFTAEKQIAIIKLISKQGQVIIENWEKDNRGFNVTFRANSNLRYITMDCITRKTVEEALAQIVNDTWQDLTDTEKQQIKEILSE
jgi:hypothetical protein